MRFSIAFVVESWRSSFFREESLHGERLVEPFFE